MKTLFILVSFAITQIAFGQVSGIYDSGSNPEKTVIASGDSFRFVTPTYQVKNGTMAIIATVEDRVTAASWTLLLRLPSTPVLNQAFQLDPSYLNPITYETPVNNVRFVSDIPEENLNYDPVSVNGWFIVRELSLTPMGDDFGFIDSMAIDVVQSGWYRDSGLPRIDEVSYRYQTDMELNLSISSVPEPSTYAAIAGAAMLGLAIWKRRKAIPTSSVSSAG